MNISDELENLDTDQILIESRADYERITQFFLSHGYTWGDSDRYEFYNTRDDKEDEPRNGISFNYEEFEFVADSYSMDHTVLTIKEFFSLFKGSFDKYAISHLTIE